MVSVKDSCDRCGWHACECTMHSQLRPASLASAVPPGFEDAQPQKATDGVAASSDADKLAADLEKTATVSRAAHT